MAYFEQFQQDSQFRVALRGVVAALKTAWETPFDRRSRLLAQQVADLRALSDAELAARGLRREDILFHVFRPARS
ncbi:hypothetical protein VK792_03345 [Mesobacterium sp. TK19101]|uniref:DUF1127 domain-containing protein n=1 Tax=Mesobacterium hydrothermale TaxID=3111907 RepID=A0ABU6HDX0_9RHOB|nr:hypothetical protein [Mesobacterium sp. TK19101]MEC3860307.1 hypothetical protein [Mesobacterium sp. TK19101]